MNHILEFAKFRDITKTKDDQLNMIMNQSFNNDMILISVVHLKNNKDILIKWYNTESHSIIEKVKKRTSFNSTSEFNTFMEKVIYNLFDNHFKEMDRTGRYSLYMLENNFYVIVNIDTHYFFSDTPYTIINIITIVKSSPNEIYKNIVINDENF